MSLNLLSDIKCFGGFLKRFSHQSSSTACEMKFTIYLPPSAPSAKVPVLYYLSGLTCTDENFIIKAGAQRDAARHGIALVAPDTSPRGCGIEGEDDSYDFGTGAGFYVDATEPKWSKNYRMYTYITQELPALINANFPIHTDKQSITGHSMGGHGALICALKNPGMYKSVSAFSPIANPIECPWGKKAFGGYLGQEVNTWKDYDATELVGKYQGPNLHILVDQGTADNFYKEKQLLTENFQNAATKAGIEAQIRMQEGYDHSYFFISTFIPDHLDHHAKHLLA